jgi:hypothetical protein
MEIFLRMAGGFDTFFWMDNKAERSLKFCRESENGNIVYYNNMTWPKPGQKYQYTKYYVLRLM